MGGQHDNISDTVSRRCNDTKLTIADFGHLSMLASYIPHQERVEQFRERYLPGWQVKSWKHYNVSTTDHVRNTFAHIQRGGTHVIAVRGTSSVAEVLQDLNFYLPVGFLLLVRILGPSVFNMSQLLEFMDFYQRDDDNSRHYQLLDLWNETRLVHDSLLPGEKLFLTGHSLGGGLAQAMGGIFDVPAVTFSAPGLAATSAILSPKPNLQNLRHNGVNIMPWSDPVPKIDGQAGTVMPIDCAFANPMQCHRLAHTMCEVLAACGDGGGRSHPRDYVRRCDICPGLCKSNEHSIRQTQSSEPYIV